MAREEGLDDRESSSRGSQDDRASSSNDEGELGELIVVSETIATERTKSKTFDPRVLDRLANEVTRDTYGTIVYQEQVSSMLRKMGFSWLEADKWQKSIKDNTKTLALTIDSMQGQPVFRKFAHRLVQDYGVSWDDAWSFTQRFTSYAFNKAHAIGYAMTAYWQMWLRVHYPLEFWSATLDSEAFEPRRRAYMISAARDGVIFLTPHVNGTALFSVEEGAIRIGTMSVKNVGDKAARAIEAARPYASEEDLSARVPRRQANSRMLGALRGVGALEFDRDAQVARALEFNRELREAKINLNVYGREGAE